MIDHTEVCCLCGLCASDYVAAGGAGWIPGYITVAGDHLPRLPETAPADNRTGPVCADCQGQYLAYNEECDDYELRHALSPLWAAITVAEGGVP